MTARLSCIRRKKHDTQKRRITNLNVFPTWITNNEKWTLKKWVSSKSLYSFCRDIFSISLWRTSWLTIVIVFTTYCILHPVTLFVHINTILSAGVYCPLFVTQIKITVASHSVLESRCLFSCRSTKVYCQVLVSVSKERINIIQHLHTLEYLQHVSK